MHTREKVCVAMVVLVVLVLVLAAHAPPALLLSPSHPLLVCACGVRVCALVPDSPRHAAACAAGNGVRAARGRGGGVLRQG